GGDPLSLSNRRLEILLEKLALIPHIKRIRFHTRFPIGIPERIDEVFLALLEKCPKQIIFTLHVNLAEELDADILLALKKIARLGIPILTQTVLLRGVNDKVEVLKKLFLTLVNNGLIPYYLHQLDPVQGAMHFEVPMNTDLLQALHAELPGYALPRFVKEEPFAKGKTLL
ncbi:MAG: EF-P beta-lysylation protein EpmB, partial [Chlamydiota bacterium]